MIKTYKELKELVLNSEELKEQSDTWYKSLIDKTGGELITLIACDSKKEIVVFKLAESKDPWDFSVVIHKLLEGKRYIVDINHPSIIVDLVAYKDYIKGLNSRNLTFYMFSGDKSELIQKAKVLRELPRGAVKL